MGATQLPHDLIEGCLIEEKEKTPGGLGKTARRKDIAAIETLRFHVNRNR